MIVVGKSCEDGIKKQIELPKNRSSGRLVDEVAQQSNRLAGTFGPSIQLQNSSKNEHMTALPDAGE